MIALLVVYVLVALFCAYKSYIYLCYVPEMHLVPRVGAFVFMVVLWPLLFLEDFILWLRDRWEQKRMREESERGTEEDQ
jgi:hypothetical protein